MLEQIIKEARETIGEKGTEYARQYYLVSEENSPVADEMKAWDELLDSVEQIAHSVAEEVRREARSAGVNDGYALAVKHLKEAYKQNGTTTTLEAIEWLADNARLFSPTQEK